jgi:hypothetical protein
MRHPSSHLLPFLSASDDIRRLASSYGESGRVGPVVILVFISILLCLIWVPLMCRHRCRRSRLWHLQNTRFQEQRQQHLNQDEAAEIIRLSINNWNLLGNVDEVTFRGSSSGGIQTMYSQSIRGMSLEDRREYIQNVLVSKVGARFIKERALKLKVPSSKCIAISPRG